MTALSVLRDEKLPENAAALGEVFRGELKNKLGDFEWVTDIRGKGLLNAIEVDHDKVPGGVTAWEICMRLRDLGLLAKQTHENIIRFAPPLVISEKQLHEALDIITGAFLEVEKKGQQVPEFTQHTDRPQSAATL